MAGKGTKRHKKNTHIALAKIQDYKQVFGSQAGGRVLDDLLKFCSVVDMTNPHNDTNSEFTYKGMRNVAKYIMTRLHMNERDLLDRIEKIEETRRNENA